MKNEVLRSWQQNAAEWVQAIHGQTIASRKFTNPAIINAIKHYKPAKILDLGCGEGWLTRSLSNKDTFVTGIDGTKELIDYAKTLGSNPFYTISFEEITAGKPIPNAPFEAIVLNFCLYLKDGLIPLFSVLKNQLTPNGHIFIQTLHPSFLQMNNLPYQSQWIEDSWKGLPGKFTQPHRWYARTLEDWFAVFEAVNLKATLKEPVNDAGQPVSLIFILKNEK